MKKIIYKTLDIEEFDFDNTYIIHSNATRYSKYAFSKTHFGSSEIKVDIANIPPFPKELIAPRNINFPNMQKHDKIKLLPDNTAEFELPREFAFHPNEIIVKDSTILESGFFAYDYNELLNDISEYGKRVYISLNKDINKYLNEKVDTLSYKISREPIDIQQNVIDILIKLCYDFGFPVNTNNYSLPDYEIISNVLPQLLLIYLINAMYNTIAFLDSIDSLNFDAKLLTSKAEFLTELKNILKIKISDFNKKVFEEKTETKLKYELADYKVALLNAINTYSKFFKEPKKIAFTNYETNSFIFFSDSLLDLAWFSCTNQITSNFSKGKKKKCKCGNEFIAKNNQIRCSKCMETFDSRKNTQQNKKNLILEILEISKNYIFKDTSIVLEILKLQELKNSGEIENIEEHKYRINKDLKPLKKKIQVEIALGNYTSK